VVIGDEGLGIESRPGPERRSVIRIYFPTEERARAKMDEVRRLLVSTGRDPGTWQLRVDQVEDAGWVEAYQSSLEPFDLGAGFRIHPGGGEPAPERGGVRVLILLVPGQAFGTGEHATTRLCVGLLEKTVGRGERWLDLGCGTGVLSIVAHHCGAGEVWGYDNDPQAVAVAREVLVANRLEDRVQVSLGSVIEATHRPWHGVVANIELSFFLANTARIAKRLLPGGSLIASGFLERDIGDVAAAIERSGLTAVETAVDGPWAAVVGKAAGA
jgi:ribosomal protein L11 methyltransferase